MIAGVAGLGIGFFTSTCQLNNAGSGPLSVVCLGGNATTNEANDVVKQFFRSIEAREVSQAVKLLEPNAVGALTNDEIEAFYSNMATWFKRCGGIRGIQVFSEPVGDRRRAEYTLEFFGNCKPANGTMAILKDKQRWVLLPD